jgi:hypothetical protein
MDMVRPMLQAENLPHSLWGEAVRAANYLKNRLPTVALDGMTPFEAWHGHKPNVSDVRKFGSTAYVHETSIGFRKGIFVGNSKKGYRILLPDEKDKLVVSNAVMIVE